MNASARRLSPRRILRRAQQEWRGSELELEIRADLPDRFLKTARRGGMREASTASHWAALADFLDSLL